MRPTSARRRTLALILGAVVLGSAAAVVAQNFDKVEIKTQKLADGLYMMQGAGGNLGVLTGADGVLLVDAQYAPLSERIKAAIHAVSDKPVRLLVNTHWHGDHVGGNENFAKDGATILAQDNVRVRMSVAQINRTYNDTTPPSPPLALPLVTFPDSMTLHVNGQTVTVFHVPNAHTDGDCVLWFHEANVIHTGDVCFNGFYPFIDLATGGSIDGMIAADDRVLAVADAKTQIIPGHGPLTDRAGLQRFRDMLAGVRGNIAPLVARKLTLEQAIATHPTAAWDSTWGKGFMKPPAFIGSVYQDLSMHPAMRTH
jgi:cyclase